MLKASSEICIVVSHLLSANQAAGIKVKGEGEVVEVQRFGFCCPSLVCSLFPLLKSLNIIFIFITIIIIIIIIIIILSSP